jgi:hypothetical protein
MNDKHEFKRKPRKCPKCGSKRIATILYGMPEYSEKLEFDMRTGSIELGGCCEIIGAPKWQCADCEMELYKYSERENDLYGLTKAKKNSISNLRR